MLTLSNADLDEIYFLQMNTFNGATTFYRIRSNELQVNYDSVNPITLALHSSISQLTVSFKSVFSTDKNIYAIMTPEESTMGYMETFDSSYKVVGPPLQEWIYPEEVTTDIHIS